MKVLMLWKYYPQYLSYFYKKNPLVNNICYEGHRNKIFDDHSGWPAELSRYMNQQGIQTEFIIANAESLQKRWAEENDFKHYTTNGWEKEIAMEQIRVFKPDILWISFIFDYFGDFVREALFYCKKAITWIACATPDNLNVSGFTTLITSHPNIFEEQRRLFKETIVTTPGFSHEILKKIGSIEKKYNITFIGGITAYHTKRAEILAYLIKNNIDLKIFGLLCEQRTVGKRSAFRTAAGHILKRQNFHKGTGTLKQAFVKTDYQRNIEIIKSIYQGPVFGLDMYRTLAASRVTLNIHIDAAGEYGGNMRTFEATGVGTCLLTEHSKNIDKLFEPGEEVLTYKSKKELLEIIKNLLKDDRQAEQIAKAGQKRTLKYHTIEKMFNEIKLAFDI